MYVKLSELAFEEVVETWNCSVEELIAGGETRSVEFKETARWNVREAQKDKLMEEIVAKTVAGFANALGGTLLIGVHNQQYPRGLREDFGLVKPADMDGYVNWLDTMFENQFGFVTAEKLQIKAATVDGHDVCRVDIPASSAPVWATFKGDQKLFVRRNNSTRAVPTDDVDHFIQERFGDTGD
jgi:predicted HTH transcriptional regulator